MSGKGAMLFSSILWLQLFFVKVLFALLSSEKEAKLMMKLIYYILFPSSCPGLLSSLPFILGKPTYFFRATVEFAAYASRGVIIRDDKNNPLNPCRRRCTRRIFWGILILARPPLEELPPPLFSSPRYTCHCFPERNGWSQHTLNMLTLLLSLPVACRSRYLRSPL